VSLLWLALPWLGLLLVVLAVVVWWLYRTNRVEVGSRFTLGDIANFVSVLLAIFALAFTLAALREPVPEIQATLRVHAAGVGGGPARRPRLPRPREHHDDVALRRQLARAPPAGTRAP
jgi:hypothetical protein